MICNFQIFSDYTRFSQFCKLFHTQIHTQGLDHHQPYWSLIHLITRSTTKPISLSLSTLPFSIWYHFFKHPRQHVAVACWAINTGCPFIGVCFPSFFGNAGANLVVIKSTAWDRMVSIFLSWIYWQSLSVNLNRDRNFDFFRAAIATAIRLIICEQLSHHTILLTIQNTEYPTPSPTGNMIHGRHNGVSLNFQAKIPTAKMPNTAPMIFGIILYFPMHIDLDIIV